MRTVIVLDLCCFDFLSDDYIIGVEKGALQCLEKNIKMDLAVGDFDSIEDYHILEEKTKVIKLPKEKDMTDLAYAISKGKGKVFILGGIQGRRIEHFYSNILLMKKNPSIEMIDQFSHIFTIDEGEYYFPYDDYKFVSFFSLSSESVISLKGFKYDLEKYTLVNDDNLCISNEIYDGLVKVHSGRVLVIKSRDDA